EPGEAARRSRRGGRRRREEPPSERPARPRFQGATPANPFGDPALDLFEAMEADDLPPAPPVSVPVAIEAVPPPARSPEPSAASATRPGPTSGDAAPAGLPSPAPPAEAPVEPIAAGPIASAEIKPIVVDEVIAEAPKKRGWWRR
ncbi:MAG: hypothetical protein SNJ73_00555, partial [Acetobacteraceae bacterium]